MNEEDKQMILSLLNESSEYNVNRLKELVTPHGGPQPQGCSCKGYNRDNYLKQVREWIKTYD